MRVSRLYAQHASVAAGLDGGDLTVAKARILWRAETTRETAFADVVDGFVELARDLSAADFAQVLGRWVEFVDDHAPPDDSKRRFTSSDTYGGSAHSELFGSADDAAIIRAAIEALDTPDPKDCPEGPRPRPQRHYDIVMDIFRRALADKLGDDPMTPGSADVIMDADTAAELTTDPTTLDLDGVDPLADLLAPYRDHAAGELALRQARRCQYPDGTPPSGPWLRCCCAPDGCAACSETPTPASPSTTTEPNAGSTPANAAPWSSATAAASSPAVTGRPKWCDAHHLKPWEDDGPTNLDNGCLLCRRHHTLIHHKGWTLQRDVDTGIFTATSPDGRQFTRGPNDRCRP